MSNATDMTEQQKNSIRQAISDCDRYIDKESPRSEDLRPQEIKDLLAFYVNHRAKLHGMLGR